MSFPIADGLTAAEFEKQFIDRYWSAVRFSFVDGSQTFPLREAIVRSKDLSDANKPALLVDDYCHIASFLASPDAVMHALRVLEADLRKRLESEKHQAVGVAIKTYEPSPLTKTGKAIDCLFKTHKLLSSALAEVEFANGFNNPQVMSHLHRNAYVLAKGEDGFVDKNWTPEERGRSANDPQKLPTGVPTSMGNVGSQDFNRVLLRHGYQFKDVGAGNDHGEYSHRLQWYAIMAACNVTHTLKLANTPLQVFKSLGSVFSRGNVVPKHDKVQYVYLWEAIFDCFPDPKTAETQSSIAWCKGTFNSPNVLNTELTKIKSDGLDVLRVLLNVRYQKRRQDADLAVSKLAKLQSGAKYKITEAYYTPKQNTERAGDSTGLLAWYLTT